MLSLARRPGDDADLLKLRARRLRAAARAATLAGVGPTAEIRFERQSGSRILPPAMTTRHLDLGCGATPRNPYRRAELHAVDLARPPGMDPSMFRIANLACQPIPYPEDSFASVSAYDFLEHVPRVLPSADGAGTVYPFVRLMDEIWRVLVPGGLFYALTPAVPGIAAFTDPTHVNYISDETHSYFCGESPPARMYGFVGRFEVRRAERALLPEDLAPGTPLSWPRALKRSIRRARGRLSHVVWELEAVKPRRA